jgi:hypothetical protein
LNFIDAINIFSRIGGLFTVLSGVIYIGFKFITMKSYELAVAKQIKSSSELHKNSTLKEIVK